MGAGRWHAACLAWLVTAPAQKTCAASSTACIEFGIRYLTIYAFSTENWGRPQEEVMGLMSIVEDVIDRELQELHDQGVQLRHIGTVRPVEPHPAR